MSRPAVVIVGCGRMGRVRAEACRALGVRIGVVHDREPAAAESLAQTIPDVAVARALAEIDWDGVDAAFVCTPPAARGPAELAAIAAGVPVLVEKPVAISAAHAAAVSRALDEAPVRTAVGYQNRYRPAVRKLRAVAAETPPFALTCHWVVGPYRKSWWLDPDGSGGPLNEQATHLVDVCRHLAGEVVEVAAVARAGVRDPAAVDSVAAVLRFESGTCATLLYSYLASEKHVALEAFWRGGGHYVLEGWDFRQPGEPVPQDANAVFTTETAAFLGLDGQILCDFEDALRTQRVVDALKRAVRTGVPQRPATDEEAG